MSFPAELPPFRAIFQDWSANRGNSKGRLITLLFRVAQIVGTWRRPWSLFGRLYLICYWIGVDWILGVDLPWQVTIGPGLRIFHGQTLVVHYRSTLGANCILRHCTTIGVAKTGGDDRLVPRIGDGVDIGSNVCIIGDIHIGDNVTVGAGSVVLQDVPDRAVVVGNPARVVSRNDPIVELTTVLHSRAV
jgi:putative colanic acid biosynthesis acetyltransferase WcaB